MKDIEHATAIKSAIVNLRKVVREARESGLGVELEVSASGYTSDARVFRNFSNPLEIIPIKEKRNE